MGSDPIGNYMGKNVNNIFIDVMRNPVLIQINRNKVKYPYFRLHRTKSCIASQRILKKEIETTNLLLSTYIPSYLSLCLRHGGCISYQGAYYE